MAGIRFQFLDKVKFLGVELDPTLTMDRHVSSIISSCNFHMRALRCTNIGPSLRLDAAKSVAVSIVGARLILL